MSRPANMPNAENCSLAELETAAKAAASRRSHVRLMAIKTLFFGVSHDQAAGIFGITRRTLSRWIQQFNTQGIDGLIDKPRSGRPRTKRQSPRVSRASRAGQPNSLDGQKVPWLFDSGTGARGRIPNGGALAPRSRVSSQSASAVAGSPRRRAEKSLY